MKVRVYLDNEVIFMKLLGIYTFKALPRDSDTIVIKNKRYQVTRNMFDVDSKNKVTYVVSVV